MIHMFQTSDRRSVSQLSLTKNVDISCELIKKCCYNQIKESRIKQLAYFMQSI